MVATTVLALITNPAVGVQLYVAPARPEAIIVSGALGQTEIAFLVMVTVGVGVMVTVVTLVLTAVLVVTQPAFEVSITETVSLDTTLVVVKVGVVVFVPTLTPFTCH